MKLRIAIWAIVGALVVVGWTLFTPAFSPAQSGIARTLTFLTCPIALARSHPLSFGFVVLVNAGMYAFVGTAVEIMSRYYKTHHRA
jgi:hypothetical protein